jgi:hypothetical protein
MATINSDNDFVNACNHLIAQGQLTVQGVRFIDRIARKIFDERGNGIENVIDITPDTATLEAALDSANAALSEQAAQEVVQTNAKTQAAAIPAWASWTETEALAWHDTNITNALPVANLAAANVVLDKLATENRALLRMVIALRNQIWSDLQG